MSCLLDIHTDIECITFEINLGNRKWLICAAYNPNKSESLLFFKYLTDLIDSYQTRYDNILVIGDLNMEEKELIMKDFLLYFDMDTLIKQPTCYKSPTNPSCIDLFITNKKHYFQNTTIVETSISDFHKLIVTVMKAKFTKLNPKVICYRNYKNFNSENFSRDLKCIFNEIPRGI